MKFSLNGVLSLTWSILIFQPHAIIPGLVGHLKNHFPTMYWLYELLKVHSDPPTQDELDMASGKKKLGGPAAHAYVSQLEKASEKYHRGTPASGCAGSGKFFGIHLWSRLTWHRLGRVWSGSIWEASRWMDCRMWSAFHQGRQGATSQIASVHASIICKTTSYTVQYCNPDKGHEDGGGNSWYHQANVLGLWSSVLKFPWLINCRNLSLKFLFHLMHGPCYERTLISFLLLRFRYLSVM